MKNVFVIIFAMLVASISAKAQIAASSDYCGKLSYKNMKMYADGRLIPKGELAGVLGEQLSAHYRKAKKELIAGIVLIPGGTVLSICGAATINDLMHSKKESAAEEIFSVTFGSAFGVAGCVIGAGAVISGIVLVCVGESGMKQIPIAYNKANKYAINIAPASSGLGFALNF